MVKKYLLGLTICILLLITLMAVFKDLNKKSLKMEYNFELSLDFTLPEKNDEQAFQIFLDEIRKYLEDNPNIPNFWDKREESSLENAKYTFIYI